MYDKRKIAKDLKHACEHLDTANGSMLRGDIKTAATHIAFSMGIILNAIKREKVMTREGDGK